MLSSRIGQENCLEVAGDARPQFVGGTSAADPFRARFATGPAIVFYIALANLAIHLYAARFYGYFGDELYFMACSRHLDWGYVDQPPSSP